ncbi:Spo0B domain-containing protein [Jeotgalibacillus sp. S-D1]|uniref:Spo0B domain-containing protein n=1 Tax=Jeotgalibacillus sp. S-D1 TaxID=2552189 RepID=UPI00140550D4|nr:Spo0B domain-containing protein [Jeotgalibacillus sp. S-D1]
MKDAIRSIELLQHSRHDWMNRLQVIKGNLELANIDRAKEVIEEIIIEVRQEAQLSSLGVPRLSEWLLTYNWGRSAPLTVKYELLSEGKIPGQLDEPIFAWLKRIVDKIEKSVPVEVNNELYLIFHVDQEQSVLQLTLEYEGGSLACSPKELLADADGPAVKWAEASKNSFAVKTSFKWCAVKQD